MSKPPRVRHSKTQREPVTIDLDPGAVSRLDEPPAGVGEEAAAAVAGEPTAEPPPESLEASAGEGARDTPASPAERDIPAEEPRQEGEAPASSHAFGRGSEAPSRPADVPPPPPARRGSGLVGGVVGGALALAAAFGLNYAGLLPGGSAPVADAPDLTALKTEVAALKADVEALKAAPGGAGVDEVRAVVTDAVSRIDGLAGVLEQVKTDLATLKTAVEGGGAGDGAAVQALAARLAELEATVASLGQGGGNDVTPAQLQELAGKLAAVEAAANAANSAAADAGAKVAALTATVAELAARVDAQADQPKVALAIAAAALRAALDRGGTFVAEVETFAAVAPNSPDLAALREIAAKGVATRADLVAAMPAAADAMIAASKVVDPNAGFWDRLVDSVTGLVTVRPIGEVPGEGVPERSARMEAALKRGDLVAALAEYDAMPDAAKAAGAELADKLRTRLSAEQLVEKALSEALKAS